MKDLGAVEKNRHSYRINLDKPVSMINTLLTLKRADGSHLPFGAQHQLVVDAKKTW